MGKQVNIFTETQKILRSPIFALSARFAEREARRARKMRHFVSPFPDKAGKSQKHFLTNIGISSMGLLAKNQEEAKLMSRQSIVSPRLSCPPGSFAPFGRARLQPSLWRRGRLGWSLV
jgi:hypothetical protein